MDKMLELAERVEKASGPDRDLDWLIRQATFDAHKEAAEAHHPDDTPEQRQAYLNFLLEHGPSQVWFRDYTASIDAAMTLVPEGWDWSAGTDDGLCWANLNPKEQPYDVTGELSANAATPALALCAAALRARAKDQSHG